MQALSQADGYPEAHFVIMAGERYLTYLFKVQGSQYQILICCISIRKSQKWIGTQVKKSFVFHVLE